ncbi:MAG: hypothetical protein J6D38_01655 [Solobacterium sp.]|nr:hypothetical protein [Solobacterium sp.]
MGPIKLTPIYNETIWAGKKLAAIRGYDWHGQGTSWEVSIHPSAQSVVAAGKDAGRTLASLVAEDHDGMLGKLVDDQDLLRAAFLDAKESLSVQVHPGEEYANRVSHDHGKTESWYILAADEGARLVAGSDFSSRDEIKAAIDAGTIEDHLYHINVKEGDFVLVPSGTLHALGAGILALEIGTNSNTTYRFYDYNRKDANGNLRELHIENSLDVVVCGQRGDCVSTPIDGQPKVKRIADFPEYTVDLIDVCGSYVLPAHPDTFRTLSCVKGDAKLTETNETTEIAFTESVFLPASCGELQVSGNCRLLVGTPRPHSVMTIKEPAFHTDFSALRPGVEISSGTKRLKDIQNLFQNTEGVDPETILYEVKTDDGDPTVPGSLSYGLTTVYPVRINGECAFTRGHWHVDETVEEVYEGEAGEGLLMLMNHDGKTWCEKVFPGSVHHIRGNLAHRLINTGDEPLKVRAVWNPCAGHNYALTEQHPFTFRVFKEKGEISTKTNE